MPASQFPNAVPETRVAAAGVAAATGAMQRYELLLGKFLEHAAKWNDRAGVTTGGAGVAPVRSTYPELLARSRRLSGAFAALGLGLGDRIATLAWNSHAHIECWYAAIGIGVSVHTLNPRIGAAQLAEMIRQADDRVLIVSPDQVATVEQLVPQCPGIAQVLVLDEIGNPLTRLPDCGPVPVSTLDDFRESLGRDVAWGGFSEEAEAGLCFTSGTTGAPKGVAYSHRSNYLVTMMLLQADVMGISAHDSVLAAVPMFHANAWGLPFAAPAAGARLVLPGRSTDGAHLAALIESEQVTLALGVPTVWLGLIDHLDKVGGELPSLERIVVGGSSIPQALMDRIEQRLGVRAQTSWGMTELSPLGTVASPRNLVRKSTLSGRPPIGVDLRLADAEGRELPGQRGVEGHLHVRGAAALDRYLGHVESSTDAEGWFDTGDLATIDDEGNLTITGRAKDLIKSGGEWINPGEIEAIVGALPAVALVAVIARSHPKWGERPIVVVELTAGAEIDDAELRDALEGRIPRWWMPDAVVRVASMPQAMTGKVDKRALRARYGAAE